MSDKIRYDLTVNCGHEAKVTINVENYIDAHFGIR